MVLNTYTFSNSKNTEKTKTIRRNIRRLMKFIKQETEVATHHKDRRKKVNVDRCYESISEDEEPYPLPSQDESVFEMIEFFDYMDRSGFTEVLKESLLAIYTEPLNPEYTLEYLRLTIGGDEEISKGGNVMAKIIEAKERVDSLREEVSALKAEIARLLYQDTTCPRHPEQQEVPVYKRTDKLIKSLFD